MLIFASAPSPGSGPLLAFAIVAASAALCWAQFRRLDRLDRAGADDRGWFARQRAAREAGLWNAPEDMP